jgi:hypothetical protein
MQEKATQKFIGMQGQESLLVLMSGVAPAERDLVIHERNEPMIGNGDAMGVSAEIMKYLVRSAEGRFAVDHPAQSVYWRIKVRKSLG